MRYIAAYLLLQMGGTASPTAQDIKRVLGSVDVQVDDERLNALLDALKGKDINELIATGQAKLATLPSTAPVSNIPAQFGHVEKAAVEEQEGDSCSDSEDIEISEFANLFD
ncbi:hypothetical protein BKA62DRAFT_826399 [Auriculariales sp. MPI-PUGE-AT-0066]|nr:hypothetical protein BKA62DRAFT_826399 [Auriculariales sp. MPI-PUGE-AT-0066]